jgi:hypothetical protein
MASTSYNDPSCMVIESRWIPPLTLPSLRLGSHPPKPCDVRLTVAARHARHIRLDGQGLNSPRQEHLRSLFTPRSSLHLLNRGCMYPLYNRQSNCKYSSQTRSTIDVETVELTLPLSPLPPEKICFFFLFS